MRFSTSFTLLSLFCGLLCVTACQGKDKRGQTHDQGSAVSSTTSLVLSYPLLHPALSPTDAKVHAAFLAAEDRARDGHPDTTFGTLKIVDVPVAGHEPLHLSVLFLTPLEQAQQQATRFVTLNSSESDPEAVIKNLITRFDRVHFVATLSSSSDVASDKNAKLPPILFRLINEEGKEVVPIRLPPFQIHFGRHWMVASAAAHGYDLDFPLCQPGVKTPLFRRGMHNMTLSITIGAEKISEEFPLPE